MNEAEDAKQALISGLVANMQAQNAQRTAISNAVTAAVEASMKSLGDALSANSATPHTSPDSAPGTDDENSGMKKATAEQGSREMLSAGEEVGEDAGDIAEA